MPTATCSHCGGSVTIQFADWKPEHARLEDKPQAWVCPHCMARNESHFAALLALVRKAPPALKAGV